MFTAIDDDCLACGVECLILACVSSSSVDLSNNLSNNEKNKGQSKSLIRARSLVRITEVNLKF